MCPGADILQARILIVGSVAADTSEAESILRQAGYGHVLTTAAPQAPVVLHRERPLDLVILEMPMDSSDCRQLLAEVAGSPQWPANVLAITAGPEDLQRALQAGARDSVRKPLHKDEFLARVRNLLQLGLAIKALGHRGEELDRELLTRTTSLRESERLFRLFAEQIREAVWIRRRGQDTFQYASPQLGRVVGRPVAAGERVADALERVHPEDRERMVAETRRLPDGGLDMEVRFMHEDGRHRLGRIRTFPIAGADGAVEWVGGVLEDVTERRNMEKGLRQAQARLRALAEQSIAGIYIVEQGIWTYVNPRFCEILGYSAEELIGHPTIHFICEDEVARLLDNRARALAGDRSALSATYRFRRKDGDVVHVSLESSMTQGGGRWTLLGIAQDVTARINGERLLREAEAHYRALVEQSLVGIYIMENGRILYANQKLRELLGLSLVELGGLTPQQLVDEQDHALIEQIDARRRAGETGAISAECRVHRKDGSVLHLQIETKVVDLAGRRAVLGVVQDISENHNARADLESANRRLQYLSELVLGIQEEERRVLSSELHDDVGQSLLALQIGLHRLAQHSVQEKPQLLAECVDIVSAVQHKLREVSLRLHPPQLTQLGLTDALRALVSRQRAITGLNIQCTFEGPSKGELCSAAEIACYRICQEALNNATRHAGAGIIDVRTTRQHGRLCLSVHDDGAGFDGDERREAANTNGNLGLISMEERARLAGGELELRTAPGAGTVVIAMFPLDMRRRAAAGT